MTHERVTYLHIEEECKIILQRNINEKNGGYHGLIGHLSLPTSEYLDHKV